MVPEMMVRSVSGTDTPGSGAIASANAFSAVARLTVPSSLISAKVWSQTDGPGFWGVSLYGYNPR
jgi:hypothetical protein